MSYTERAAVPCADCGRLVETFAPGQSYKVRGRGEYLCLSCAATDEPTRRCLNCGDYEADEPGICFNFDTPDGYPEPFGTPHVWVEVDE